MKLLGPSIQWYYKQFIADDKVLAMDWDAVGMHIWLINLACQQDPAGTIPDDIALIRRWLRSPSDETWRRVWPQLSAAWIVTDGDRRANAGTIRACQKAKAYSESRKHGAYALHTRCIRDAREDEVEDTDVGVDVVVDLKEPNYQELIYADYPRKVGKAASLKAIGKALLKIQRRNSLNELDAAQFLHKAVIEYSRSPAGNRGEYTPHCATWMNQERWTDDRTEWQKDYRNGTNQPVNRSRARQDAQRDELRRAEEMDSQGTFDSGDYDERNSNGGSLKRLCESVGGPAATQVAKGIPTGRANPEILPKASRTN